jgi:hypothetical protein
MQVAVRLCANWLLLHAGTIGLALHSLCCRSMRWLNLSWHNLDLHLLKWHASIYDTRLYLSWHADKALKSALKWNTAL